jgi:methylated-DNA-[protein]-cysteine S-methyltransferase
MQAIRFTTFDSPLGTMLATAERDALSGLYFVGQRYFPKPAEGWREDAAAKPFAALRAQLAAYWSGDLREFDLPLDPGGGRATTFQRAVWDAIYAVKLGATTTYAALATACGRASAVRAAGAATGRNPISVIIPCHRIVGSDGSLTGYAGGLDRKRTLLAFEHATANARAADVTGRVGVAHFVATSRAPAANARTPAAPPQLLP